MDDTLQRFWEKVDVVEDETSCWRWKGKLNPRGYGQLKVTREWLNESPLSANSSLTIYAHRISFVLEYGEIPLGLLIYHRCGNRGCVRPSHLFLARRNASESELQAPTPIEKPTPFEYDERELNDEDLRTIRHRYFVKGDTVDELSSMLRVTRSTILAEISRARYGL